MTDPTPIQKQVRVTDPTITPIQKQIAARLRAGETAIEFDGWVYELYDDTYLCRYEARFEYPDILSWRASNSPEARAAWADLEAKWDKEQEHADFVSAWFLNHPSA